MAKARKIQGVYRIKNVVTGGFYFGSTGNLYERWRTHKKKLRSNTHPNPHLQASWNKHGEEVFRFELLADCQSLEDMDAMEETLISENIRNPLCYNLTVWARSPMRGRYGESHPNYGKPMSDEQKTLLAEAAKNQWAKSDPRTGKRHSEETKAKISAKIQQVLAEGRGGKFIPSEETRRKMSESLKGNQCAKGHKRTAEDRAKISERMKGKQLWLGKKHSEDTKAKLSKRVVEVTSDTEFSSLTAVLSHYGMTMPTLRRALVADRPITKGKFFGLHFRYVDAPNA